MMLSLRARWGPWGKVSDGRDGCVCEMLHSKKHIKTCYLGLKLRATSDF